MFILNLLNSFGRYIELLGRTFQRPERWRMFGKQYLKEMAQLGVNSIGIVLLISFFIGAVICIQIKLNILGFPATLPEKLCYWSSPPLLCV